MLSEHTTNAWVGRTSGEGQMKKPRFRSLWLKSYFGQGNGTISFNLREERVNQQPMNFLNILISSILHKSAS